MRLTEHDTARMVHAVNGRQLLTRVFGWTWGIAVAATTFEVALYLVALILYPHLDTPECASADTFCSPEEVPGLTGGAGVVLVGNLVAAIVCVVVMASRSRHQRTPH